MPLTFYGQFSNNDEEDKKKPSQVAGEQVKSNQSGLNFYGTFADAGAEVTARASKFKASEPAPTPAPAPAPEPAKQNFWDQVKSTVSEAINNLVRKNEPVVSPLPSQPVSASVQKSTATITTPLSVGASNVAKGLSLDLGGAPMAPSATLTAGPQAKADSIYNEYLRPFEQNVIKPLVTKGPLEIGIEYGQNYLSKPENSFITKPLAVVQETTNNIFNSVPLLAGFQKGAAGMYMNNAKSFEDYAKTSLKVPEDFWGKAQYTVGEVVGGLVGFIGGGEVVQGIKAVKGVQAARTAMPLLYVALGQTSASSDTTVLQRLAKMPLNLVEGFLFGMMPTSTKLLSKDTLKGAGAMYAVSAPVNFINNLIQGLEPKEAAKVAAKAAFIQSMFHVATIGLNQATSLRTKQSDGVTTTPEQARVQVESTNMPDKMRADLKAAILKAEAQGKDIKVSAVAVKPAPVTKVIGKEATQAITGQKQMEGIDFKIELVDKKTVQLLSEEGGTPQPQQSGLALSQPKTDITVQSPSVNPPASVLSPTPSVTSPPASKMGEKGTVPSGGGEIPKETPKIVDVYRGSNGKVEQLKKTFDNVLTIDTNQFDVIKTLAQEGNSDAKALYDSRPNDKRVDFTIADKIISEAYKGKYDAIEYKNSQMPQIGTEYHDLKNNNFYASNEITAKQYANQKRELKYQEPTTLYHGSKVSFSQFDMTKLGTGDGSDKFGQGAYLTDNKDIAQFYAEKVAKKDFISKVEPKGVFGSDVPVYKPNADQLAKQNAKVNEFIADKLNILDASSYQVDKDVLGAFIDIVKGRGLSEAEAKFMVNKTLSFAKTRSGEIVNYIGQLPYMIDQLAIGDNAGKEQIANILKSKGYDGIKYQSDRKFEGKGAYNYVIYNPDKLVSATKPNEDITVYHGTQAKEFIGTPKKNQGKMGNAFYLSNSEDKALAFGKEKSVIDTIVTASGKKVERVLREPNAYPTSNVYKFSIKGLNIRTVNDDMEFFRLLGNVDISEADKAFRLMGYDGVFNKSTGTYAIYNPEKLVSKQEVKVAPVEKTVNQEAVQEATNAVVEYIRSGDLEGAAQLHLDLTADGDVKLPEFKDMVAGIEQAEQEARAEIEDIKSELKADQRANEDTGTSMILLIADKLAKYFSAPKTLYLITGMNRTYQLPNGDKMTVGGNTKEALDRLIYSQDIDGFKKSINFLSRKFNTTYTEINFIANKVGIDGGDYEKFKASFREQFDKRPNYSAGRSGIVKDLPKQKGVTASQEAGVTPVTPISGDVKVETVEDRVQAALDEKQKNKEVKDVGERVGGSKKEMSAFKKITVADLSGIDNATAYDLVTKDRVIGKFDPQQYKDAGYGAGITYIKSKLHSLLRAKPENSPKARELFITRVPEIMKQVDDAKTLTDLKDIKVTSSYKYSWQRSNAVAMSDDEMIFGKSFINLVNARTEAARETWREASKFDGVTEDTLKTLYETDKKQREARLAYRLKRDAKEHENNFIEIASFARGGRNAMRELKTKNPQEYTKQLNEFIQRDIETAHRMYDPMSYETFMEKNKSTIKPDDWSWMQKESVERKERTGIAIHTVEPLKSIKRVNGRMVTDSEIDPKVLIDQYGYESVQFGNSITDKESKAHIRHYVASMKDLEDVLQLDISQVNREAKLSIAFAARGSGGALAHYESMRKIINITRTKGGGSSGHEWFHYLDHVIGGATAGIEKNGAFASRKNDSWFLQDGGETPKDIRMALYDVLKAIEYGDGGSIDTIRTSMQDGRDVYPTLRTAYKEKGHAGAVEYIQQFNRLEPEKNQKYYDALAVIEGKDFEVAVKVKESKILTQSKKLGAYWSSRVELIARTGQAYIQDKMAEQGISNNYLTHNTDATQAKFTDVYDKNTLEMTYPQGAERLKINKAYDKLFAELRKKYPYHQSNEQRVNEEVKLNSEAEVAKQAKEEVKASEPARKAPTGSGNADVGGYRKEDATYFTGKVTGIEFPELLQLAVKLTGEVPSLKDFSNKLGVFYPRGGGQIKLNYEIFKDPAIAAKVFAHEIGHLVDYLPNHFMAHGNILGRIATLNKYMERYMPDSPEVPYEPITEKVKEALKAQAKELSNAGKQEITPEDVLAIWNSVEAKNKTLESYIAKLSAEQKKEMLKDAIKGVIPEWVDLKAPNDKWQNIYERLLKDEIVRRKLIDEKEIRQELKDLTQYWKPFDENADKMFTAYRYSSKELYADAISVLLNNPELLQLKAPKFYKSFFNYLDNKPEVKNEFINAWDTINKGEEAVFRERQKAINDSELQAEEKWRLKEQEKNNARKNLPYILATLFQDKDAFVIGEIAKKLKADQSLSPDLNPKYVLHSLNYLDGEIRVWMDKKVLPVFDAANKVEGGWSYLNQILQWERAIYERGDMANPHGHNPKTAADSLRMLEKTMGEEDWNKIQEAKDLFRTMVKDFIDFAGNHGYYKPELIAQMKANPAYAAYQVVDYLDTEISPKIYKAKGTLKGVANTATSTVMKLISTYKAIARNDAKMSILETLKTVSAEDIEEAKSVFVAENKPREFLQPKDRTKELVIGMKDGQAVGYYVPKEIASSLNYHPNDSVQMIAKVAKFVSATAIYRPVMTTLSLGFQIGNAWSDFIRAWENYPDRTLLEAMQSFFGTGIEYAKILPAAYRKAKGINDPIVQEMMEKRILGVGFRGLFSDDELASTQKIERVLGKYGAYDITETNKFKAAFEKVYDSLTFFGEVIESMPKIATYSRLRGRTDLSEARKSEILRTQIGSPDFLMGGVATPITNAIFMFSNAQYQATVADISAATNPENKKYRSAYWFKFIIGAIIPALISIATAAGLLGKDKKEEMDNISDFDKTNYNIIPIGLDANGKTIYIRIRKSERDRFVGGLMWKMYKIYGAKGIGLTDLMDITSYAGGQLPNVSPNFKLMQGLFQYFSGQNPYDEFRGRNVIPDQAFKAGQKDPKYSAPYMINWILDTTGARIIIPKVPTGERMSGLEKVLNLPILSNAIGKWVKVSDYGKSEQFQEIKSEVQNEAAAKSIDKKNAINEAIKQFNSSDKGDQTKRDAEAKLVKEVIGDIKSSEDKTNAKALVKQFRKGLIKGEADPVQYAILTSVSNAEKVAILKDQKTKMSGDDFYKLLTGLYEDELISVNVAKEARR